MVFACITTEGYINSAHSAEAKCIFNQNDSACQYAVAIGVIAFLACVSFLVLEVYLPYMSNAQERKYAVLADLGFSGELHQSDTITTCVYPFTCTPLSNLLISLPPRVELPQVVLFQSSADTHVIPLGMR